MLVPDLEHHERGDFERIAGFVRASGAPFRVKVVSPRSWARLHRHVHRLRPVVVVGLRHWGAHIHPVRGVCLQGETHGKAQQYERMEAAGFPTIPWCRWTPDTELDSSRFGPYVITKPDVGARGRSVKLRAGGRLRYRPEKHGTEGWLVQRFVHTGAYPVAYRVLTFFGRPLLVLRSELRQERACEDPTDKHQVAGHNPVASAGRSRLDLVRDAEIEAYAARLAKGVYPDVPVLGLDILREARDGTLHCCELNPWGHTWHFSSEKGRQIQKEHGLDFEAQFDAFRTTAEILIDVMRARTDGA